jgi:2-polyprenyl-6-methoxyphenol hydroxylase-like FAD-dependent oxidoreductase
VGSDAEFSASAAGVLLHFLEAQGGAEIRWTRLIGLSVCKDAVVAMLARDGEPNQLAAQWVVGCDGLHNAVRQAAGITYPGVDINARWAVVDATIDGWQCEYDVAFSYFDTPPVILTALPARAMAGLSGAHLRRERPRRRG